VNKEEMTKKLKRGIASSNKLSRGQISNKKKNEADEIWRADAPESLPKEILKIRVP
jgi:hypothetical protein